MLTFRPAPFLWCHNRCISFYSWGENTCCEIITDRQILPCLIETNSAGTTKRHGSFCSNKFLPVLGQRRNAASKRIRLDKKATKENTELWFPLTYLGCSCHTQGSQDMEWLEINPVWETGARREQTPQVQAPLSDNFRLKLDTQTLVLSFPVKQLCLPLRQFAQGKGNPLLSLGPLTLSRPWKQLEGSDS